MQAQDILTKDKVTLRLNASMTYRVVDVTQLVKSAKSPEEILYLCVQLGLREQVALHTLDEILSERGVLADNVKPAAVARATEIGLELIEFGVKDILADNPVLMRLKELESYKELAEKVGTVNLIMSSDGLLPKMELKI